MPTPFPRTDAERLYEIDRRNASEGFWKSFGVEVEDMNLALIDPFQLAQDYPDCLTNELRSGHATTLRFNRKGDYLASGRVDGKVVVWDMETMGVAMKMHGHVAQITSLSWSRTGRYLLSASQDWRCILWDLADGSQIRHVIFTAPCYIAELHPYNHFLFVVSLYEADPYLVDISEDVAKKTKLPSQTGDDDDISKASKQATTVAIFTALGNHILSGTSKGFINIIETQSARIVQATKLSTGFISSLRLSSNGRDLLVNSSDRVIRTVALPDLSGIVAETSNGQSVDSPALESNSNTALTLNVEHKFQDLVNRLRWNHVAFSGTSNADYVTAATYMRKDIYIWEREKGSLVKILENREELSSVEWHPNGKPLLAACSVDTGSIYIWSVEPQQKWSALAPDFQEVDNNVEYLEREDEFHVPEEAELNQRRLDQEDEEVNVIRIERLKGEEEESFVLPVLMDIENSEDEDELITVGVGTMRRRDANEGRSWNHSDDDEGGTPAGNNRRRR
ncbi:putative set1 complex component swd1 [Phaeomoniella chlamydospora]|uniref:Putative set1 complex component swd1 n=1 Tax=Phaeomoniella chlamydospora TaxID=158046 RepID=A0A0G2E9V8_PHACM|nr:putative set1 complex component swd1 [Phaeomoniella chlamydospora]